MKCSTNRGASRLFIVSISVGATLVGCATAPPSPPPPSVVQPVQPVGPKELQQQTRGAPASPGAGTAVAGGSVADTVNSSADARYTIVCTQFTEPAHVQQARRAKESLVRATGRADFFVVHEERQSTLYFGYYKQIERAIDPAEAVRAEKDLVYLRTLTDPNGNRLFPGSLKQALPVADPDGPPEFDLARLDQNKSPDDPKRRYWSIAIGGYDSSAVGVGADAGKSRKQLALDCVMEARRRGIEAYYFHGPNVSTICIGAWPRSAVREQDANQAQTDADNGADIAVSTGPMPSGMRDQIRKSGHEVKVFEPKIDVEDPALKRVWTVDYPNYSINGGNKPMRYTNPKTGRPEIVYQKSFLFEIPRTQAPTIGVAAEPSDPVGPTAINPLAPAAAGGRLRSLGQ